MLRYSREAAAALALVLASVGLSGQALAQSGPNVTLANNGLWPDSNQDVKFTISNAGAAPSTALQVNFLTLRPYGVAQNPATVPLAPLGPGQDSVVTYHLAGPCAANWVAAEVSTADDPDPGYVAYNICSPDLQVTYKGLQPGSNQVLAFTITNIGDVDAPNREVQIKTENSAVDATPPNPSTQFIPPLDRGQSVDVGYELADPCNGHFVRATIVPENEENSGHGNLGVTVCQPLPDPNYQAAGPHTLAFQATLTKSARVNGFIPDYYQGQCSYPNLPPNLAVGWALHTCGQYQTYAVTQTAVQFDTSLADLLFAKHPSAYVTAASITFDEARSSWTDRDGKDQNVRGCVWTLGMATSDVGGRPTDSLFPNNTYAQGSGPTGTFDVTDWLERMLTQPQNSLLRNGFVLRGVFEQSDLAFQTGNPSCLSTVSNLQLQVSYTLP